MNFLEKVDFLMERYGLNKLTLSQNSGIPYTTIVGWYKKGYEGLKLTTLRKLAEYFNTSIDYWIIDDITDPNYGKATGFQLEYEEMEHIKKYRPLDEYGKEVVDSVLDIEHRRCTAADFTQKDAEFSAELAPTTKVIPLFSNSFAAGRGEPDFGNPWEDYEVPIGTEADFAVRIHGDSMEPYLPDGSIQLCRKGDPVDGDVAALLLDGTFICKQVCKDMYGNLYLFSLNRNRADADQTIWHNSDQTVTCFGTVILPHKIPLP